MKSINSNIKEKGPGKSNKELWTGPQFHCSLNEVKALCSFFCSKLSLSHSLLLLQYLLLKLLCNFYLLTAFWHNSTYFQDAWTWQGNCLKRSKFQQDLTTLLCDQCYTTLMKATSQKVLFSQQKYKGFISYN